MSLLVESHHGADRQMTRSVRRRYHQHRGLSDPALARVLRRNRLCGQFVVTRTVRRASDAAAEVLKALRHDTHARRYCAHLGQTNSRKFVGRPSRPARLRYVQSSDVAKSSNSSSAKRSGASTRSPHSPVSHHRQQGDGGGGGGGAQLGHQTAISYWPFKGSGPCG